MANSKISQLPNATIPLEDDDYIPVVQGIGDAPSTKKVKITELKQSIQTENNEVTIKPNQTGTSYTLQLNDKNALVSMDNTLPNTIIIPSDAEVPIQIGTQIIINQSGTGQTSVMGNTGVTLLSPANKNKLAFQHSIANILKVDVNNWIIYGDITSETIYSNFTIRLINANEQLDESINVKNNTYILDQAEADGLNLPYSCRAGQCTTCACKYVSGVMPDQLEGSLTESQIAAGFILICVAKPLGDLVIETHQEENLYQ
ncbi:2Fe-2S iron-sulfur cluster-binding protein [Pedobacter glucosidilyticus]|uniref:2Fe-2S iron-sulfur cluster-binding protein n=1 Tax=Pedobacter glucosidilyticus TaxID=1122941 RepID=UPI00040238AC|nr:2Fe-2S iron-sulfur cluster-binding protein [Pedobacter glucosidilyticus]